MMLFEPYRPVSWSFSQRMSCLEKAAYYRPLSYVTSNSNRFNSHRSLECDCNGFECEQQNEVFYEEIRRAVRNARSIMFQEIQTYPKFENGHYGNHAEYNKYFDDSSECREFLRVQYNLNNLYRKELEMICKKCKNQRQELMKEINNLRVKLQKCEDNSRTSEVIKSKTI